MVKVKPGAKVITIEPGRDASTTECVVVLFSAAFGRVCAVFPCALCEGAKGMRILAVKAAIR
jgi:hypothetical protein